MIENGYTFDYISDKQVRGTRLDNGVLKTEGDAAYETILLPAVKFMEISTLQHVMQLAEEGATILVMESMPGDVPGFHDFEMRKQKLTDLLEKFSLLPSDVTPVGKGRIIIGDDMEGLMNQAGIIREPMVDKGLKFIRRGNPEYITYFVSNQTARSIDEWIGVGTLGRSDILMDPMTGQSGLAHSRKKNGNQEVYLQLEPGETRILRIFPGKKVKGDYFPVSGPAMDELLVSGTWNVEFTEGGPSLPSALTTDTLMSWTRLGDKEALRFAGAARYSIDIELTDLKSERWMLDLGDVRESARVSVNSRPVGVLVAHPYRIDITDFLQAGENSIAIEVTNLSANRIRDLDIREVDWKKFYDINFVTQNYQPFDASIWDLKPSGLLGPVKLLPYKKF
ncbi:hypothetical protein ES705_31510 [subsurface metagenome]